MYKVITTPSLRGHQASHYDSIDVVEQFGMPLPTHIHIYLTDTLVEKMHKVLEFMQDNSLSTTEFISSHRDTPVVSYIELYKNERPICIAEHEDFGKIWDSVDLNCFTVFCETSSNKQFSIQIIYVNGYSEFVFNSSKFSLKDLEPVDFTS